MGEYAEYQGKHIKIGTCENMYYLRAQQATWVHPLRGSLDPVKAWKHIRFRFPWPDEDGLDPGEFEEYDRGLRLHVKPVLGIEHYRIQFCAEAGYLLSLPCPESAEWAGLGLAVHRNGYGGETAIVQQRVWGGRLVLVVRCVCGSAFRLESLNQASPWVDAALGCGEGETARRIVLGYTDPPEWVKGTAEKSA